LAGDARRGGEIADAVSGGEIQAIASVASALGWLRIAASESGICRVSLQQDQAAWQGHSLVARALAADAAAQLREYFDGHRTRFELPLDLSAGSHFQQAVWRATQEVPFGAHVAYGHIAAAIGMPQAGRAVGQALKRNPLLILVPCHRVVRMRGGLGGFRVGEDAKLWLLRHEGAILL
jgi:methylated-DNA-[protein]-cysteine S-methyltransferase